MLSYKKKKQKDKRHLLLEKKLKESFIAISLAPLVVPPLKFHCPNVMVVYSHVTERRGCVNVCVCVGGGHDEERKKEQYH